MSTINCAACDELREIAPELLVNGITKKMCTSLQNDTGLNNSISPLHNDKTDMDYLADCSIGRMAQEIKAYDVCDWKAYMKKLVPNIHDMIRAINCVDAGQWTNIHDLWDYAKEICEKVEMAMYPTGTRYGTFPYATNPDRVCGTIATKSGSPLLVVRPQSEIPDEYEAFAGPGVLYEKKKLTSCSGACAIYEWFEPWFYMTRLSANAADGDVVWYVDKSTAQSQIGFTDAFWEQYSYEGQGWTFKGITTSDQSNAWFRLVIDENNMGLNYLTLVYEGSSYPTHDQGGQNLTSSQGAEFKVIKSSC